MGGGVGVVGLVAAKCGAKSVGEASVMLLSASAGNADAFISRAALPDDGLCSNIDLVAVACQ